ncbi:MAG: hypothetical protein KY452_03660 [Actinobacteria bacterium]|nr:hypothetical protein [Actinomycetota bacterium]
MAIGDPRLADDLVQQIEAELAALDDRAAAANRAGNIIHACARLAVFVAQLPSVIFDELERDGVVYVQRGRGTFVAPDYAVDEKERRALALDVARRALVDAHRNGLGVEDLVNALNEVSDGSPASAALEEGEKE